MTEEKQITVKAYRDKDGLPTCAVNFRTGDICQFQLLERFGPVAVCAVSRIELDRRDDVGSLIPCEKCIVWRGETE